MTDKRQLAGLIMRLGNWEFGKWKKKELRKYTCRGSAASTPGATENLWDNLIFNFDFNYITNQMEHNILPRSCFKYSNKYNTTHIIILAYDTWTLSITNFFWPQAYDDN